MHRSFLPSTDAALLDWSGNFSTRLSADYEEFGIQEQQAIQYAAAHAAYAAAYAAAQNPETRTKTSIVTKNDARRALRLLAGQLGGVVQNQPFVTNTQRALLGLTIKDVQPSPQPVPAMAPTITVLGVNGRTVSLRLSDPQNPTRRGKPEFVDGLAVFSYVGENAPEAASDFVFQGNTTRTVLDVTFPNTVPPGATVWFTAMYFNERKQSGPASTAVSTQVQFGGISQSV